MDNKKLNAKWPESFEGSSQLPGIPNIGYTCFANSTMQVLNHTPAFINHFRDCSCDCKTKAGCKDEGDCDGDSEKSPEVEKATEEDCYTCLTREYVAHLEECNRNKTCVSAKEIRNFFTSVFRTTSNTMQIGSMGDGEELLMHLESKLEDDNKYSIMRDIFYSRLAEIYRCKHCGNERRLSKAEQVYLDDGSVMENLAELSEEKDFHCQRDCEKCQVKREHTEKTVFESPPHVLQISFKPQFDWNNRKKTEFPAFFNIRPFMEDACGSDVVYELYAVVIGGLHYWAYCKAPNGQWNECDDRSVTQVSLNLVLRNKHPFSLYYMRSPRSIEADVEEVKQK